MVISTRASRVWQCHGPAAINKRCEVLGDGYVFINESFLYLRTLISFRTRFSERYSLLLF
jgi:hypothetical protein